MLVYAKTYRAARGCKHVPSLDLCSATPGIIVIHTAHLLWTDVVDQEQERKLLDAEKPRILQYDTEYKHPVQVTQLAKAAFEAAVLKLRFKRGKSQNVLAVWEIKRQVSSGHYDKACTQG